ncbi:Aste57867_14483 [Aphanomyces stellatus]|uniref:Aste57867_14483 protein n=1 Tax=Aphanomyces stellatus TaxID=120398 RepID=A0A485L1V6_9STRA|nr:hypothetical protein As57867_014429 [Aphanomyces stellatus]VFT91305.1 Aste57867_14483 [Aphanomyces stellatus]
MMEEDDSGHLLQLSSDDTHKIIEASWLVEDAFRGFSRAHPKSTKAAVHLYKIHHRLAFLRRALVTTLLLLTFVETPYWCQGVWPHPCGDPSDPMTPLTSGMLLLSTPSAVALEAICLLLCVANDALLYAALGHNFLTRFDRICAVGFFLLALANAVVRLVVLDGPSFFAQLAPFLRLAIFMVTFRSIRSTYRKMYLVMAEVHNIMTLVAMYVLFFAWLATILFQDTDEATIMPSYSESAWQFLILLTTANFPDVMMPAYTRARSYALFFVVFVAFGLFFLMNLILAQVFNNFQRIAAAETAQVEKSRAALLTQAFDLLVHVQHSIERTPSPSLRGHRPGTPSPPKASGAPRPASPTKRRQQLGASPPPSPSMFSSDDKSAPPWIDTELAVALCQELSHYNVTNTRMNRKHMQQLVNQLDTDGDGCIQRNRFFDICERMAQFVKTYHKPPSEVEQYWPAVAASHQYQTLCTVVQHRAFEFAVDGLLILNALCIVMEMASTATPPDGGGNPANTTTFGDSGYDVAQVAFSSLYLVEMLLKMTVFGVRDYVHYARNRFDAVITIASLAVDLYAYVPNEFSDHTVPKVLMTFRCVRMLRLFFSIERYRVIISTAFAMVPMGKNLLLVMFCNMNVFALVGHHLFGGLISPGVLGTAAFANSTFAASGYAANNFNDVPSAMVTLFELLVVNNWFVIVEGHVLVTSVWARLFFVGFWLTGVLMTLNLIVASILDAFSKEYALAQDAKHTIQHVPVEVPMSPPQSPRGSPRRASRQLVLQLGPDSNDTRRIA